MKSKMKEWLKEASAWAFVMVLGTVLRIWEILSNSMVAAGIILTMYAVSFVMLAFGSAYATFVFVLAATFSLLGIFAEEKGFIG